MGILCFVTKVNGRGVSQCREVLVFFGGLEFSGLREFWQSLPGVRDDDKK